MDAPPPRDGAPCQGHDGDGVIQRHEDHEDITTLGFIAEAVVFLVLFFGLPALAFLYYWSAQP